MHLAQVKSGELKPVAIVFLLTVFLLLVLAVAIPRGQDVLWLNGSHNRFLDIFYLIVTNAGDGAFFVPLILIFLFIRFQWACMLLATAAFNSALVFLFKHWLLPKATRPIMELDHALLHFVPGVDVHAHHSFPSGHTASIFAIAFLLALFFNRKMFTTFFLILALFVAASRIYLLQHFLSDVAIGALVGILSVFLAIVLINQFKDFQLLQRKFSLGKRSVQYNKDGTDTV